MEQCLEGQTGQPFTMMVELGKIREFARATKSANPAYLSDPDPVSPATFLASSMFWQGPEHSPYAPRDWARVLHGEQEFVFPGPPPRAGTVLTGQARIDRVYEKEGRRGGTMTFTEVIVEYRDDSGTTVALSRGTLIETRQAPSGEGGAS